MISPGCDIRGTVERSVLAPGVVIEEGAGVRNAIILENAVVRSGAQVQHAIVDRYATVGSGARVGEACDGTLPGPDDIAMVGQHVTVHGNRRVGRGERITGLDALKRSTS